MPRLRLRAAAITTGCAFGALILLAAPASAHVRVFAPQARPGHPAALEFRVPSEKAGATTVRVDVTLPPGVTVTHLQPVTGWTAAVRPGVGGVPHLIWTARPGAAIRPDEHRYFRVRVGPLPDVPVLTFNTAQTYSDGSVVEWNEPQTGATPRPFPSPVLTLDPRAAADGTAPSPTAPVTAPAVGTGRTGGGGSVGPALLGTGAFAIAAGVSCVLTGVRRRRRSADGKA